MGTSSGFGDTRKRSVCSGPVGGEGDLGQGHGLAGGANGTDPKMFVSQKGKHLVMVWIWRQRMGLDVASLIALRLLPCAIRCSSCLESSSYMVAGQVSVAVFNIISVGPGGKPDTYRDLTDNERSEGACGHWGARALSKGTATP